MVEQRLLSRRKEEVVVKRCGGNTFIPVDAVSRRGDVLVVKQNSAALEAGDADVRLPGELAEGGLIAADDPLL